MFTGIIEGLGVLRNTQHEGTNLRLWFEAPFADELRIDQSIAHNGVCLTVEELGMPEANGTVSRYAVVAVAETLQRSNLGSLSLGHAVNLERCLKADSRLDGHFVQGHVDATGTFERAEALDGSYKLWFTYPEAYKHLLVEKGSICINGVSLTVVDCPLDAPRFSVVIIPYTWQHTNLGQLQPGAPVNLEFDILGKYLQRHLALRQG